MTIGERIFQLRFKAGMTQQKLESRINPGGNTTRVCEWESGARGEPNLTSLRRLAAAFGLSLSQLLRGVE